MKKSIPDCYDPIIQEARRDASYAAMLNRLPKCMGCGHPITSEMYLDLEPFGVQGRACEHCYRLHRHYMESDYE